MEGKTLIQAFRDLQLRDVVALVVIILFAAAVSIGSAEIADLVQAARSTR